MNDTRPVQWTQVGKAEEWPDEGGKLVKVNSKRISVYRHENQWYALKDSCPHAGVSLERGPLMDGHVMCPGHGWRFSLKTGEMAGYPGADFAVATFPVRVTEGIVEIGV
jgi:nitrite reductase/ring-hydroxylating ferredoxin subunit